MKTVIALAILLACNSAWACEPNELKMLKSTKQAAEAIGTQALSLRDRGLIVQVEVEAVFKDLGSLASIAEKTIRKVEKYPHYDCTPEYKYVIALPILINSMLDKVERDSQVAI